MITTTEAQGWIERCARLLRVEDWHIRLEVNNELDSAFVSCDREQRKATITYNPNTPKVRYFLAHEVAHIMFYDMSYLACDGRSIDLMNMYTMLEERAANVVADLLL